MDLVLDVGVFIVNLYAVAQAFVSADRKHRFGHVSVEALAGMAQSEFVAGLALFFTSRSGVMFDQTPTNFCGRNWYHYHGAVDCHNPGPGDFSALGGKAHSIFVNYGGCGALRRR